MLLAILVAPCIAASIDGSTGFVRLPSTDTVGAGEVGASLGLQLVRGYAGTRIEALPIGFAAGVTKRAEVGGHIARDIRSPRPISSPARATAGFHLRLRTIDPIRGRPGVAVQAALVGIGASPTAEAAAIAALRARRSAFVVAGGPRFGASTGVGGWAGVGLEGTAGSVGLVAEQRFTVVGRAVQLDGRFGARLRLRDRASLLAWSGGGTSQGAPWLGGGISLQLSSVDPRQRDVDVDAVPDWTDRCPFEPEDPDGFDDEDGCPDEDNDGDGIPDALDPTPNGEPLPDEGAGEPTPQLKMRIKPRRVPGPIDPARRKIEEDRDGTLP